MITLLCISVGLLAGSLYGSRHKFAEYLGVRRYRAFVRMFPDHPAVQWHDEEFTAKAHKDAKNEAVSALGFATLLGLTWPVMLPVLPIRAGVQKLSEKNYSMTRNITLDLDRIREEEGVW